MPVVDEDLEEGFNIVEDENGVMQMNRTFFCYNLTGSTAVEIFASALLLHGGVGGIAHTGGNIPLAGSTITVNGKTLVCRTRELDPWPPKDAIVRASYSGQTFTAGFGPKIVEVDTSLEQGETDFDWDNLQLAFNARQSIKVPPPAALADQDELDARAPIWSPKSTIVITREQSADPEPIGAAYVGWTNADIVRSNPVNTLLMMSIKGRNAGTGIWTTTYFIAKDPIGEWKQVVRWRFPDGRFPAVTAADITAGKGIVEVIVQGSKAWAGLALS